MIIKHGNLFDTEQRRIGHGVNTEGKMGAGIAKTFKENYPKNYIAYHEQCHRGTLKGGDVLVWIEKGKNIYNLASQEKPGANATYPLLFESTNAAAKRIMRLKDDHVLAIPQIGCGIGGLEWDDVQKVLRTVELINPGFEFEVWIYE